MESSADKKVCCNVIQKPTQQPDRLSGEYTETEKMV